jgi:hypothetical protein
MASDKWALCNSPQNCCGPLVNPLGGRKQPEGVVQNRDTERKAHLELFHLLLKLRCASAALHGLLLQAASGGRRWRNVLLGCLSERPRERPRESVAVRVVHEGSEVGVRGEGSGASIRLE